MPRQRSRDEALDGAVVVALVPAAGDEHDGLVEALERVPDGVHVRRLRVVDVLDAADLADGFEPVRHALERGEALAHDVATDLHRPRGDGGGERVVEIVPSAEGQVVSGHEHLFHGILVAVGDG